MMKNESKTELTSTDSCAKAKKKKKHEISIEDPEWKIAARNRAAQLSMMKRTTFPDTLSVEPVDGQKVIQFLLIIGIGVVLVFTLMSMHHNYFMRHSTSRRAAYLLVYKAVHNSKMTKHDRKELNEFWNDCPGMYVTTWTPWRLALRPHPDACQTCHKVVKLRTRVIVAREPPERGEKCPATLEWMELDQDKYGDMVFDGRNITRID